jgi:predicted phosphodiesterase
VDIGDGATLHCFHGSPRSFHDIIRATTPDEELDRLLAGSTAQVLAGGHTHERMLRRHAGRTLLNPGSIGLPSDPPWAEYAIVEAEGGIERVTFQRVRFDVARVHAAARDSGMPHAEWWIGLWG